MDSSSFSLCLPGAISLSGLKIRVLIENADIVNGARVSGFRQLPISSIKSFPSIFRPPCVMVRKTCFTCIGRLSAYNVSKTGNRVKKNKLTLLTESIKIVSLEYYIGRFGYLMLFLLPNTVKIPVNGYCYINVLTFLEEGYYV